MITKDACKFAIGAVMEQEFEDGVQTVCLASRVLSPAEETMIFMIMNRSV